MGARAAWAPPYESTKAALLLCHVSLTFYGRFVRECMIRYDSSRVPEADLHQPPPSHTQKRQTSISTLGARRQIRASPQYTGRLRVHLAHPLWQSAPCCSLALCAPDNKKLQQRRRDRRRRPKVVKKIQNTERPDDRHKLQLVNSGNQRRKQTAVDTGHQVPRGST